MMSEAKPVVLLDPHDPRWVDFISARENATIFHHPAWSQLLTACYGYRPFVIAWTDTDGTVGAGVPVMDIKSPITGRRWVSLPFSDCCPPLWKDDNALHGLVKGIVALVEEENIPAVELRGMYSNSADLYVFSDYVIHEAELSSDTEMVLGRVHEMHRRNIKIATAENIQIARGETLQQMEEFYNLHLRTRRNQGVPVQPWKFFKELKRMVLDQGLGYLLLAYKNQHCIAGAVFLHWSKTLTYKYGASSREGLTHRPNNLIMWTAMQWGCRSGFTHLDLGRSYPSNQGLCNYKSRWGAHESPLWYASLAPRADRKYYDRFMDWSRVVIQKSPLWVCRMVGEIFYKHFG